MAAGNLVAVDLLLTGRLKPEALSEPEPVEQVVIANMAIFRLADGRVVEASVLADRLDMLQQLGVREVPPLAPCPLD